MTAPAIVVFDIGRVLLEWHPERPYDARIGADARRRFFAEVDVFGMNLRGDAGEDLGALVAEYAEAHPGWADEIRLWREAWDEQIGPPIAGTVAILRALKSAGVPVWALSNFAAETFETAEGMFDVLGEFDGRVISAHVGLVKPDPQIYALFESAVEVPPGSLFFVDDRADNVAAARARGWRAHVFDGPEGLARRLGEEGLALGGA